MSNDTTPPIAPGRWALLAAGIALTVYLLCLPPTITGEDAGELVVAAQHLGVPHPPGYPTWTLYAHAFTWFPWGSVAWRVALSSAVAAAATVGLLCALLLRLTGSRTAALGASLALAFSLEFWEQAIIPEVYALNAFCFVALLAALRPRPPLPRFRPPRTYRRFGFGYGLALGVHNTIWLLGPLLALYVWCTERHRAGRWATYFVATLFALAGASVFLYLPWASARNPPVDWGNPETLSGFLRVLRRDQYAFMMTENPHSLMRFLRQCGIIAQSAVWQFTPWVGLLGLLGLPWMLRRHAAYTLLVTGSGLLISAAFILAQNFTYDAEWLWVMSVFQIPLYIAAAFGLAGALAFLAARLRKTAVLVALICVASPLLAHAPHNNRAGDTYVAAYAQALLDTLPQDAIFIPTADHETFPILYLQHCEGQRPDVTLGRKYGYLEMALWKDMPDAARFGDAPPRRHDPALITWLAQNSERPLYVSKPFALPEDAGLRFTRQGLLLRVEKNDAPSEPAPPPALHVLPPANTSDYTGKLILLDLELAWAAHQLEANDRDAALAHLRNAARLFPGDPRIGNNLAAWCARNGFPEEAAYLFRDALGTALAHLPDDPAVVLLHEHLQRIGDRPM
jgi:hypothetical protein